MSEEEGTEKKEPKEVRICITIPTKEAVMEKIKQLFPSAKVEEEETTEE